MKETTFVPNRLLARDAVDLGRLVLDVRAPEQDYFVPQSTVAPEDILVQEKFNFSEILQPTSGSNLHSFLTTMLSTSMSRHEERRTQIDAVRNTTYQIKNSSHVFERICGEELGKKWLEKAIGRGRKVYMVVGIQTMMDAEIWEHGIVEGMKRLEVTAPIGLAISAATSVPIPLMDLDVGGGKSWRDDNQLLSKFFAPGEQVYAVQYRKVNFSWFSSKKMESLELAKSNRWKVYWLRSAHEDEDGDGDEEEDEDVVEVKVANESLSALELGRDGYEHFELDNDGSILFSL